MPDFGFYDPDLGVIPPPETGAEPTVLVSFYRSYLTAADTDTIDTLIRSLRAAGFAATGVFAPSLKVPGFADWLAPHLTRLQPAAVVNATAFSARADDGSTPFDTGDFPVFQIALARAHLRGRGWHQKARPETHRALVLLSEYGAHHRLTHRHVHPPLRIERIRGAPVVEERPARQEVVVADGRAVRTVLRRQRRCRQEQQRCDEKIYFLHGL
jgi:hypothetical protein